MKQVAQRMRDGSIHVLDVPDPEIGPDEVLVDVTASLLSAGTERTKIETGRQSLLQKARSRPDQVKKVIDTARRDGVREAAQVVRSRLEQPSEMGYSSAGVVRAVGARVRDLKPGDRVACGGGGYAVHAEVDRVPNNLCVPVPASVPLDAAAFATVGAIALHGVRQADVRVGEKVAVIGLGLVGQLTAQLLQASGCSVVGIDLDPALVELARSSGAADVAYERSLLDAAALPDDAAGCDAVVITAATSSSDPVEFSAALCRDRGTVVIVGTVGMEVPRAPYFDKEIDLRISRSYGPGRYDPEYEERALDYPIGYVRWTERRNMQAFVDLIARGRLDISHLISDRVPVERAEAAYERLLGEGSPLGLILTYGDTLRAEAEIAAAGTNGRGRVAASARQLHRPGSLDVGVIGAGSFAQRILIPGLKAAGFPLRAVASGGGLSAKAAAERFEFDRATSVDDILADDTIGLVVVATRHSTHAELAERALRAGKAVFVEKPPALTLEELTRLRAAADETSLPLVAGFNRRYAPTALALRDHVAGVAGPIELIYRVNAGALPAGHWLTDASDGGGRLLGEGCHFVDFACWALAAIPTRVSCLVRREVDESLVSAQSFSIALEFEGGSLATIHYGATGAPRLGKEYVELHAGGRSAVLNDFTDLKVVPSPRRHQKRRSGSKGHIEQLTHLRNVLQGKTEPVEPSPLATMLVTLAALESARTGCAVAPADLVAG